LLICIERILAGTGTKKAFAEACYRSKSASGRDWFKQICFFVKKGELDSRKRKQNRQGIKRTADSG